MIIPTDRRPVILVLSAIGFGFLLAAAMPTCGEELRLWSYPPHPMTRPLRPRPSDEEFLKIVPPLRPVPQFTAEQKQRGMALWWADYSQLLFSEQPPSADDLARPAVAKTPPGEDEPLVLGLWGIEDVGLVTLRVRESPFPVTIRRVEFAPRYVPTRYQGSDIKGGRVVGFATYLPENGTGEVKQGANTVFWINVQVPAGTEAGTYRLAFELTVHQRQEVLEIPATVEVLDFSIPRADIAYGMYFRPTAQVDPRYRTPQLMHAYWQDMARHGMTSATLYNYQKPLFAESGALQLDDNPDIQRVKDMMADGLLTGDIPIMLLSWGFSEQQAQVLRDELKKRGLPEFLLYTWDEPPLSKKVRDQLARQQPFRQYMRLVTALNDAAAIAYADLLDVWVVHSGLISPQIQALARDYGAELWTYNCTARGTGNSSFNRFYAGLYTWALELKGNFIWCYHEHYSWEGDRNAIHCWVLPSDSGPVPSVAWEARREGVEDYRLLKYLESLVAANPERAEAQEAQQWLDQIRGRVDWYLTRKMPPHIYPWDGPELYPMCPDFEPSELAAVRAQLVEYIDSLLP